MDSCTRVVTSMIIGAASICIPKSKVNGEKENGPMVE